MNWFRQNRFLGTFLSALGLATLLCAIFVWWTKSSFDEAKARFDQVAMELATLQRHNPFPTETNLGKMKTQAAEYATALGTVKEDLKKRVLPLPAEMKPNEFQARLRQAMTSVTEKARANKVKLPDNFFLGFDEFVAALPETAAAPFLGQELAQIEMLLNLMIDAHVDAIVMLRRVPLAERAAPTPPPGAGRKPLAPAVAAKSAPLLERNVVEVALAASPGAARRVLNQIATAEQQFYIVRTLHVLNEKDKGPPRAGASGTVPPAPAPAPAAASPATAGLNFIVGNEHVQATARIEMLRFTF
ncbi:MAG TPA: Amuc_1100 family pilus-like protein [Chthoniobacterales bacterium]|nr:Amuc_1100 family pilus-like protein [Chthoniobacterales bacterium]